MDTMTMGETFAIKEKKTLSLIKLVGDIVRKIKCKLFCCCKSKCSINED